MFSAPAIADRYSCVRGAAGAITVSAFSKGAAERKVAALRGWRSGEVKCSPVDSESMGLSREPKIKSRYLPADLQRVSSCRIDGDTLGLKPCTEYRSRSDDTLWRLVTDRNSGSLREIHFRKERFWIRWAAAIALDQAGYLSPEAKAYLAGGSVNPRAYLDKRR